jgi:hypothetical protein
MKKSRFSEEQIIGVLKEVDLRPQCALAHTRHTNGSLRKRDLA